MRYFGYVRCPQCNGESVRNGVVRGVQRYRCRSCDRNFVTETKNRTPRAVKFEQVVRRRNGRTPLDGASIASIDRWVLEAQEHHEWFLRAIAEWGVKNYRFPASMAERRASEAAQQGKIVIDAVFEAYETALLRDPKRFLSANQFALILDFMERDAWWNLSEALNAYLSDPNNDSGWVIQPKSHRKVEV